MFGLRRHRLITVLFALFGLLFMQLAVAGYSCPVGARTSEVAAMAEADLPCAGDMVAVDAEQPGLCHAHCQSAQQTVERMIGFARACAGVTGFAYAIEPVRPSPPAQATLAPSLLRTTAPPITV